MALELKNVSYVYGGGTNQEVRALKNISLTIPDAQHTWPLGHTGSGPASLHHHLTGLIKATEGDILYNGQSIYAEGFSMLDLRSHVGLVFQYPEHQLFEVDVFTDVCFGPKNLGLKDDEVKARAREALDMVGLDSSYDTVSPFELSGGQKRRVAIAGVMAMKPEVLILDEPTAGLDPRGRDEILDQVAKLHREQGITVILVSHSMEDVARYADRLIVMNQGEVAYDDEPKKVFLHYKELEGMGLAAPQVTYIVMELRKRGFPIDETITTVAEAKDAILTALSARSASVKRETAGDALSAEYGGRE